MTLEIERLYLHRLPEVIPPRGRTLAVYPPSLAPPPASLAGPVPVPKRARVSTSSTSFVDVLSLDAEPGQTIYVRTISFFTPSGDAANTRWRLWLNQPPTAETATYDEVTLSAGENFNLTWDAEFGEGARLMKGLRLLYPNRILVQMRTTDGAAKAGSAYIDAFRVYREDRG